ncbi:MAG: hypothetical protein HQK56_21040 [Deltaproteobacteria bacterium]|nr:hypothetical protein [Deltaproteobacteria bacterium]
MGELRMGIFGSTPNPDNRSSSGNPDYGTFDILNLFESDDTKSSLKARLVFNSNSSGGFSGLITSVPTFSFGSGFSSIDELLGGMLGKQLGYVKNALQSVAISSSILGAASGGSVPQLSKISRPQTIAVWTGCDPVSFSLDLLFLDTGLNYSSGGTDAFGGTSLKAKLTQLINSVMPSGLVAQTLYTAPLGYSFGVTSDSDGKNNVILNPGGPDESKVMKDGSGFNSNAAPNGTINIQIGEWFTAYGFLVKGISLSPSFTLLYNNGKQSPMCFQAKIDLRTYCVPTAQEVNNWFILG